MMGGTRCRAVALQLVLAALVAGVELIRGPTLPPRSPTTPRASDDPRPDGAASSVTPAIPGALSPPAAVGVMADDAAWREIIALRREGGGLLKSALWRESDAPGAPGTAADDAAAWEEAEFSQALRRVLNAAATR